MAHKKSVAFDNVLCKEDVFGDCDHVGFFLSRCWICYTYEDDEDALLQDPDAKSTSTLVEDAIAGHPALSFSRMMQSSIHWT